MKSKKTNRKSHSLTNPSNQSTLDKLINSSLLALAITIGISIALLLISTAIALSLPDPLSLIDPIGYVSLFISAFFGGFAASKLNKRSPYITSAICGLAFVIFSMLISVAIPHSLSSGMDLWTRLALHVLSLVTFPIGALAGIKGSKPQIKKKRR